ncbi:MAG: PSD1 and planctomycete cytochrome C domain-containing protein [Verrucomicrobiota bacterium]
MKPKLLSALTIAASLSPFSALAEAPLDFEKDVLPIFEATCLDCHDRDTLKGGVGLDSFYHATMPTDAGDSLFVPGKPEDSVLYHVVVESDPEKRMPPKGDPLYPDEIEILKRWIEEGAEWPDDGWRPPVHWSFEKPERSAPPAANEMLQGRDRNEIDRFIAAKLAEKDMTLNPEAEPERVLRRLSLDLTGLPPTVEQIDAFLADPSEEHLARFVDELLASPAFGEKWATQWLDLARYADSEGYQRDAPRNMWPYRDWVIQALNEDMPFDQFSIEQLAGDLLPDATESQQVATAFHRNSPTNLEAGTDVMEDFYKVVVDRTNTTGTIWLGLTVGCAQCHNHKYDPISAKEYYELFAFFHNTPVETKQQGKEFGMSALKHIGPTLAVTTTKEDQAFERVAAAELEVKRSKLEEKMRPIAMRALERKEKDQQKLPEKSVRFLDSGKPLTVAQMKVIQKELAGGNAGGIGRSMTELEIMSDRLTAMREKTVRVMQEIEEPRQTFIAKRGDFLTRGQEVFPATPAALHPFPEDLPKNRLGLAQWLVSPENPLVARTFVNRLWIEIFGQGLVTTPEDFGTQGELPTHPELLDWLAVTFIEEDGWSLKKALRRIVLSTTYRQSIAMNPNFGEADPRNQLLWRHPGHRLGAETIRDQALSVSGLLSERMHGVHSRPYQPDTIWQRTAGATETYYIPSKGEDAYRRGVYTIWRRNNPYPMFINFDATDRGVCVIQRDVSNTPLQALNLLNDPVYVEMAEAFARRIATEGGQSLDDRIEWAFRTVLARFPRESEHQLLESAFTSVLGDSNSEQRAYFELATILLNLHETINRS